MSYEIKITRILRSTQWEVRDATDTLTAWGNDEASFERRGKTSVWKNELRNQKMFLTIAGAKKLALHAIPSGAEYKLVIDTSRGIKHSGPYTKL